MRTTRRETLLTAAHRPLRPRTAPAIVNKGSTASVIVAAANAAPRSSPSWSDTVGHGLDLRLPAIPCVVRRFARIACTPAALCPLIAQVQ